MASLAVVVVVDDDDGPAVVPGVSPSLSSLVDGIGCAAEVSCSSDGLAWAGAGCAEAMVLDLARSLSHSLSFALRATPILRHLDRGVSERGVDSLDCIFHDLVS